MIVGKQVTTIFDSSVTDRALDLDHVTAIFYFNHAMESDAHCSV